MLEIVSAMDDFGTIRTEPTLAMGGGLITDVCGLIPKILQLHPYPHDPHWSDRCVRLDQGRYQPRQAEEPVSASVVPYNPR